MVSAVIQMQGREHVLIKEELEELITLVLVSTWGGGIDVTTDKDKRVRIFFGNAVNSGLQSDQILTELGVSTSSREVNSDVDGDLVTRFVQNNSKDTAGGGFKDRDIGIKFLPPHG